MVPDWQANTVYLSDILCQRYPAVAERLLAVLRDGGVAVRFVPGTRDVWIRDYAPVQVAAERFVKFCYRPDYLHGYEHLITDDGVWAPFDRLGHMECSPLVVDGGNVVISSRRVLLTVKVYRENRRHSRMAIRAELRRLFDGAGVFTIPVEPGDLIGHSDGVVRFLDDSRVVVSDFWRVDRGYGRQLEETLDRMGLDIGRLPYRPSCHGENDIPPATGNYVNFLRVGRLVVVPAYGLPEDEKARRALQRLLPEATVVSLRCDELARDGGCWNCATWTARE